MKFPDLAEFVDVSQYHNLMSNSATIVLVGRQLCLEHKISWEGPKK